MRHQARGTGYVSGSRAGDHDGYGQEAARPGNRRAVLSCAVIVCGTHAWMAARHDRMFGAVARLLEPRRLDQLLCREHITRDGYHCGMDNQNSLSDELTDASPDGQWMTVAELAALRRISKGSADRLARQRRWRRQPDQQGQLRLLVPHDAFQSAGQMLAEAPSGGHRDRQATVSRASQERVKAAEQRAERAEKRAREAEQARLAAEAAASRERDRAAMLLARTEAALAAERKARAAAEEAAQNIVPMDRAVQIAIEVAAAQLRQLHQAETARRARGLLARLWAAWRGD